jgi:hypothetical protein
VTTNGTTAICKVYIDSIEAASRFPTRSDQTGRIFREWAAFAHPTRREWNATLGEARRFVND